MRKSSDGGADTLFTANDVGSLVQSVSDWPFKSVRIPALSRPGSQILLEGKLDKDQGAFGLDGIHFSTRQRCSPRLVHAPKYSYEYASEVRTAEKA